MENNTYIVYKHTNLSNNKCYIGITKYGDNPNKRWRNGYGYQENKKFFSDIVKYGWDNFSHVILLKNLNLIEAQKKEQDLIKFFNSIDNGYNISSGGQCISQDGIKKIQQALTGIKRNKKSINQQLNTKFDRSGNYSGINPLNNPLSKKVQCNETLDVFCSIKEAENWCGSSKIGECCQGNRAHAGKHPITNQLLSWKYVDKNTPVTLRCPKKIVEKKQIKQVQCIETNKIYNNASEASRETGISVSNILRVCKGERKTAGKFHWQFI